MNIQRKSFLIDTNTFITPFKEYYPFDFAPSFWRFLGENILNENISVLSKVYDEVVKVADDLSNLIEIMKFLILKVLHKCSYQ
jgi:hypothetical protein